MSNTLPFLDLTSPEFSTRSDEVRSARDKAWCARTPFGIAVLRHRQAGMLLRDRRLRQGSYDWPRKCGLEGSFARFWSASIISQEGGDHKKLRRIAQAALSNDFVLSLRNEFRSTADELVEALRENREFDFLYRFNEPYAGRAVTAILGLPASEADWIADDASSLGLAMGMGAKTYEEQINAACDRLMDLADTLIDRAETGNDTTSFVARMLDAGTELNLTDRQTLKDLIVISIFGGVDTTRAQLSFAMALFAEHPEQWAWLRAHKEFVPQAIEEIIRTRPTTTWSTREALETFELDGIEIQKGETVHILVHATATDPIIDGENRFDITADRKVHFGFGGGAHHCLGQFVARTDMAEALMVLLRNWREVHLAEPPEYLPDSGNTSPLSMPLAPVWA
ncbi:MAG: cytochrome P450 [Boseongicola sp.]|nr:cytochrome P450 [Boseongicola sp.]